jgi:hypothetical protein
MSTLASRHTALACMLALLSFHARTHAEPPAARPEAAPFGGAGDDALLKQLCEQPITTLQVNRQGTTIKFKAVMADGTRGSLRPAQPSDAGYFRADVAAYLLARALGLGTVAPSCLRTVTREQILGAEGADRIAPRLLKDVSWSGDGKTVAASVVLWVDHVRSAGLEQDLAAWRPLLEQSGALAGASETLRRHAAEGSRLLAWDFLIANWDRWSGSNTFRIGRDGPYVWLDNAAGFGHYSAASKHRNEAQLEHVERFSRALVGAMRALGDEQLGRALGPAGLSPRELKQLLERRAAFLRHVDALIAKYGAERVLCFD